MNPRLNVVQIRTANGEFLGSGFFTSSTEILTCRHVVKDRLQSKKALGIIVSWLGEERLVQNCRFHRSRDAAILKVAKSFSVEPQIAEWALYTPAEGRQVRICGFCRPNTYGLEHLTRFIRGYAPKYDLCVLDQAVSLGLSGSPAYIDGIVVGIVVAIDRDRTFMIPVTALTSIKPRFQCKSAPDCILDIGSITPVPDWGAPAEVKFTLTNTSTKHIKITSVSLNVVSRKSLLEPHHFLPGAIVKEYELKVHLTSNQDVYELLTAHHVLKPSETDGFRLQIESDEGWHYSLLILVDVKILGTNDTNKLQIGPFDLDFRICNTKRLLQIVKDRLTVNGDD